MKAISKDDLYSPSSSFIILSGSSRCQVAAMVLKAGETSGAYGNEHRNSDQVMFVLEGEAEALVNGVSHHLSQGDTILIEAGEPHQIKAAGEITLKTLNVYAPPGY